MEGKENILGESQIRKLMTVKDVAEILGIAAKTVNKLVREAKLGCVQVTAKERRFTDNGCGDISSLAAPRFKLIRDPVHKSPHRKGVMTNLDGEEYIVGISEKMSRWT
jgi:hypothetical protein